MCAASRTGAVFYLVLEDSVADAFDEQIVAAWAVGVLSLLASDISDVDEFEALFECYLTRYVEGLCGGGGQVPQFVVGEESGKMQRGFRPEVCFYPADELADLVGFVVEGRDQQVGDFDEYAGSFCEDEGVKDGLESGCADRTIEFVGEGLEIYVGGIDVGQ